MKNKLTTAIFFNHCFDKRRFQSFLYWFFKKSHSGQLRLLNFLEKLKFLGFHSATQAGFSMSIDDLKIPSPKSAILASAENIVLNADLHLISGHLTTIERYQRILETWNRTSEKLKYQVLQSFQISDFFNPVYLMAFSGARGNISQIRQLVGMRGLMADPQGKIIDFPIRSNFREGLTLTEYLISCSGARKGIVDTALRTAASGYLTRRLVDVAHHVIISQIDCQQNRRSNSQGTLTLDFSKTSQCGIWIEALYEQQKEILPLEQRLVGRILAETITFPEKSLVIGLKDQEITQITSQKICKYRKKVLIRSPLTCQSSKFICQLCYGWNLSEGQLVSVGEAVGVLAAQSIGEPGTQLTMRTFHTGGVFTGRLIDQTYAPFFGTVHYNSFCNGLLIRTLQGRIAYLSKNNGILSIHQSKKRTHSIDIKSRVKPMAKAQGNISYFILEKLRFNFNQLASSPFKIKFELKPIYSNFVLDPMTDLKAKNKSYFQKIKNSPLLCKSKLFKYNEITGFSHQTLLHSQAFIDQFKKLNCQLKEMISLNQTWLTSNKQKYKLTNTCRFHFNFIFNISQIYQKYQDLYGHGPKAQASKNIGRSGIHLQDQSKSPFEKQIRFVFQIFTLLYVRQGENVFQTQLIAELPFFENEKSLENEQEILSNEYGEIYFENFVFLEKTRSNLKTNPGVKIIKDYVQGLGEFWILFGRSFQQLLTMKKLSFFRKLDLIDSSIPFAQIQIDSHSFLRNETLPLEPVAPDQSRGRQVGLGIKMQMEHNGLIQLEQINLFSRRKKMTLSKIQNLQLNNFSTTHLMFKTGFWSCRFLETSFHQQSRFFDLKPVNQHWIQNQLQTRFLHGSKTKKELTLILQKFSRTFQMHLIFFKNSGYLQIYNLQTFPSGLHTWDVFNSPTGVGGSPVALLKDVADWGKPQSLSYGKRSVSRSFVYLHREAMPSLEFTQPNIPAGRSATHPWGRSKTTGQGVRRYGLSTFVDNTFWKDRKNYQKLLNKNFETWMIGLQRQSKYIPKYSDCHHQFFKISRKHFDLQFLKIRHNNFHPIPSFLNLQKQKRNFFFSDTSFRIQKNSQKFFCEFQNQTRILNHRYPGENQIGASVSEVKKMDSFSNRIQLPFFFHENTCILLVNRQGISQFFGQEIIQNPATFNSISRYWMVQSIRPPHLFGFLGDVEGPQNLIHVLACKASRSARLEVKAQAAQESVLKRILSSYLKSININFQALNRQVFGFCKVSFRIGTKKCWRVSQISKNQLPQFCIKIPSKKNLNVYHWLSNSIEKSRHLWLFKYPLVSYSLQFFKGFSHGVGLPLRSRVEQENIQSFFCTLFLKQSKLFQNLPKNWTRQITNTQPKIIHWGDLPFQKYIFLISFLKEVGQSSFSGNLYKFVQSKNLKTVNDICRPIEEVQSTFQKWVHFPIGFNSSNFNLDWKIQFWKIQQRQERIGYPKWKMGGYSFIRIFLCIEIPSFKSIQWVQRLEPKYLSKFSIAKLSLIFAPAVKYRSYWKSLPSCFKNLFALLDRYLDGKSDSRVNGMQIKPPQQVQLNLTKLFLKTRYRQQVNMQYQSSFYRQNREHNGTILKKFLFNKEKLSTDVQPIDPKNWTLFSNFLIPKQNNQKGLWTLQTESDVSIQRDRKHNESNTRKDINRLEKMDQGLPPPSKTGMFSISTELWTSKFLDFSDLRLSFPGDEKLKNNFQNIQLGSPNELTGIFEAPENRFSPGYQWKFFGDYITIMEQKLYPTYFQNFSSRDWNVIKRDRSFRTIESFPFKRTSSLRKTQIQNRFCTIYPSFDQVLKQLDLNLGKSTTNNWFDEISETKASVFLLNKILPKSLCSLESGIFKNRILPFYNQIESSKLQKCILDVYFGSYCQILQNFSLLKNFTSRFSQNQPKKPIYNMFSVTLVDTIETQLLSKYKSNFEIQKMGFELTKINDDRMPLGKQLAPGPVQGQGIGLQSKPSSYKPSSFRPKFKNSNFFSVSAFQFDVLPSGLSNRNHLRVRIERLNQCLKTKFRNSGLSQRQNLNNQRLPNLPIGQLNPVVYQIHTRSNNKNKLNSIFNGSNHSIVTKTKKNTINLQKYAIQNFFEYQTHFHNFYIEYISKKSSSFKDDFYQIRNFHKFNLKSWLNRTKNFQKYSIRYLKSKCISKKLNLFIKNPETLLRDNTFQMANLSHKKILNKTLFLIQQQENQQTGSMKGATEQQGKLKPICCFILKFYKKNWDNFYSINLSHYFFSIQTDTKGSPSGQNRKFFRIALILNPKSRTSNQKNMLLADFFPSKLRYRSKTNLPILKLHFRILTIIQTLFFVYRSYHLTRDQSLTELPHILEPMGYRPRVQTYSQIQPHPTSFFSAGTRAPSQSQNNGAQDFAILFPNHLKVPIFYIPLFDQNYEILLTSIFPLTLNPKLTHGSTGFLNQTQTKIVNLIPKIWDQTHFLKIYIIQTKRLDFLNLIVKTQFQHWLNSENKDVCNFQIIKKNDLKSFEIQIFIRFFFPFHLGEIIDLNQKTKHLLLTNIEDLFSYHPKVPSQSDPKLSRCVGQPFRLGQQAMVMHPTNRTRSNSQNYPIVWDEFFNLLNLQLKNKTKRNFANTFLLNTVFVAFVHKVQQFPKGLKLDFKFIRRAKIDLSQHPIFDALPKQTPCLGQWQLRLSWQFMCVLGTRADTQEAEGSGQLGKRKDDHGILSHQHLRPSFQKNIVHQNQDEHSLLGSLMGGGQEFNEKGRCSVATGQAGQLIAKTRHIFLYRKATTHLLNNQSILHVQHGEIISKNQRLYSVFYSQSKTGDIVQGIPKIE